MYWWQWIYFIIAIVLTVLTIMFLITGIRYFSRDIRDSRRIYLCEYSKCENKEIDDKYIEFINFDDYGSKQKLKMHYECYKKYVRFNDVDLEIIK